MGKKQTGLLVGKLFFMFVQIMNGVIDENESPQRMQNFPFQKTVLSMFSEVFLGGGCRACGLAHRQNGLSKVGKNSQENH